MRQSSRVGKKPLCVFSHPNLQHLRGEGGDFRSRTLGGSASAAGISSHGDGLGVLLDVLEEGHSALQLPAVNGLGGLAGVLEGHSEVGTAGAGRLGRLNLSRGVSNLSLRARSVFWFLKEKNSLAVPFRESALDIPPSSVRLQRRTALSTITRNSAIRPTTSCPPLSCNAAG